MTRLKWRLGRRLRSIGLLRRNVPDGAECERDSRYAIIDVLMAAEASGVTVRLGELHNLAGLPQPLTLRCVKAMKAEGVLEVEHHTFDPFAAQVELR